MVLGTTVGSQQQERGTSEGAIFDYSKGVESSVLDYFGRGYGRRSASVLVRLRLQARATGKK